MRRSGEDLALVVLNLTPAPREGYRIGTPSSGRYDIVFSSDDSEFGGSQFETQQVVDAEAVPFHGYPQSLQLRVPPLGALILAPSR